MSKCIAAPTLTPFLQAVDVEQTECTFKLPTEVTHLIFFHSDAKEIDGYALVCKKWRSISRDLFLWRGLCKSIQEKFPIRITTSEKDDYQTLRLRFKRLDCFAYNIQHLNYTEEYIELNGSAHRVHVSGGTMLLDYPTYFEVFDSNTDRVEITIQKENRFQDQNILNAFAATDIFLALATVSFIEVRERGNGEKNPYRHENLPGEIVSMFWMGSFLYFSYQVDNRTGLGCLDWHSKEITTFEQPVLMCKPYNENLLAIKVSQNTLIFWNVNEHQNVATFTFAFEIIDYCLDASQNRLAVALDAYNGESSSPELSDDAVISKRSLCVDAFQIDLKNCKRHLLTRNVVNKFTLQSFQWQFGSLWLYFGDGRVTRIETFKNNPLNSRETLVLQTTPVTNQRADFWLNGKIYRYTPHVGLHAFDFLKTGREILKNIGIGHLNSGDTDILRIRFYNLPSKEKDEVVRLGLKVSTVKPTDLYLWPTLNYREKADAIFEYLKIPLHFSKV